MNFSNQLERLRAVVRDRDPGVPTKVCAVLRDDLRELLYHFDRLDAEVRSTVASSFVTAVSDAVLHGISFSVDHKNRYVTTEVTCVDGTTRQYRTQLRPDEMRNPRIINSVLTDMLISAKKTVSNAERPGVVYE